MSLAESIAFVSSMSNIGVIQKENAMYMGAKDGSFLPTQDSTLNMDIDHFTSQIAVHDTLPSISNDVFTYDDSGWSTASLQGAVPSYYDTVIADDFIDSKQDVGGKDLPIAESQMDAAPSDPMDLDDIGRRIYTDMGSEDKNLSGGITSGINHIGVNDANVDGPDDLPELLDFLPQQRVNQRVSQPTATIGTNANVNLTETERSDLQGDIGQDTAVQSSFASFVSELDERNYISPYLPLPNVSGRNQNQTDSGEFTGSGVDSNLNRSTIDHANRSLDRFKIDTISDLSKVNEIHMALTNVQHEIMSIDNIVYFREKILTPNEKQNKAELRIQRLEGAKLQLSNILLGLTTKDTFLISSLVTMHALCTAMENSLQEWISNPSSDAPLNTIENIISPCITFNMIALEKASKRYEKAVDSSFIAYSHIIDSYQDSDKSERDISKILKYDVDLVSPSYNNFTINMKRLFNDQITSTLLLQRKMRSHLKAATTLSKFNSMDMTNAISTRQNIKQSVNTVFVNTDNNMQKTPKTPFNVKTSSRRLNLLETPVASNKKSVIYVNEYEKSKLLFS